MKKYSILILLISVLFACNEDEKKKKIKNTNKKLSLEILDRQKIKGASSLSGFEAIDSHYFAVSDNTAFLYKISQNLDTLYSKEILNIANDSGVIIDKSQKPDFESLTYVEINGKKELLIFGSGSKSPQRNILIRTGIELEDSVKAYKLDDFYNSILQQSDLPKENLNIEGVVVDRNKMYLFNRGNNAVWEIDFNEFINYIEQMGNGQIPKFKEYCISLPIYKKVQAGFSGATMMKGSSKIIFTASLEDTENWIDDGNVLGSYLGVIEIDKLKTGYEPRMVALVQNDEMLQLKVESAGLVAQPDDSSMDLLLVTDEDGEISEAVKVRLGNL